MIAEPRFLRFWAGRTASFFATELSHFILPVTAATLLQANAVDMGLLAAAQTAPALVFGLVAGAWTDRWPRGRLLVAADLASAAYLALAPFAAAAGMLTVGTLSAIVFMLGSLNVLANVAYQSLLPSLAGRQRLVAANASFEVGAAAAETAGPALGGFLLQAASWPAAVLAGVLSFAAGGLSAIGLERARVAAPPSESRPLLADVVEGVRFVISHRGLRWVVVCGCVDNLLGIGLYGPLYVLFATRTLGVSSAGLGVVFAATGAGAVLGALLAAPLTARAGVRATLVASQLLTGFARVALALVQSAQPGQTGHGVLVTLLAAEFVIGATLPLFNVNLLSLRQAAAPDALQGRVNATVGMLLGAAAPIGGLAGGIVAELVGLRTVLATAGVLTCLVTVVLFFPPAGSLEGHVDAARTGH